MKITVVGFWHGYPERNEATSCYLLQYDRWNILLDCGSGALSQLANYCSLLDIDAVVLSHYHHDHAADIGSLQYACLMENRTAYKNPLIIYGHNDREYFKKLPYKDVVEAIAYDEENELSIGPYTFSFLQTVHPKTCYAMKIKRNNRTVVYTADTSYFDELVPFAKEADLLIAECSGYKGDNIKNYGHMTSECVATLAKKAEPHHVLLSHLPHYGDHAQLKKEVRYEYDGKVTIAQSGVTIQV